MKSGRELDVLVAVNVMGFADARILGTMGAVYDFTGAQGMPRKNVPNYSTDIASAWKIIEKIPMTIHAPTAPFAHGEYANSSKTLWVVECGKINPKPDYRCDTVVVEAETAAHAICLAALKSVGVGV